MEFLSRLHTKGSDIEEKNFLFEIDRIRVYSSSQFGNGGNEYHDICGFLFKESDIISSVNNHKAPSRDEIRAALVAMHSYGALKPTEESATFLYKMLSGSKKKKSRGKKDEDEEEEEDDDDEVLRIVRRKETNVRTTVAKKIVVESKVEVEEVEDDEEEDEEDAEDEEDNDEDEEEEDENAEDLEGEGEDS